MTAKNYTESFTGDRSTDNVFAAINNVRGWWPGEIDGRTDKLGAEFTCRYQDLHRSTQNADVISAIRSESKHAAALRTADWLHLAAAPTFAIMALLTCVLGGGQPDIFCLAMQDASPLGGMVPMYLLMSAFHLAPWLKLMSGRRGLGVRSRPHARGRFAAAMRGTTM
jgi:hypothetical protein